MAERRRRMTGMELLKKLDDALGTDLYEVERLKFQLEDMDFEDRRKFHELHPEIEKSPFGIGNVFREITWNDIPELRELCQKLGTPCKDVKDKVFSVHLHCIDEKITKERCELDSGWIKWEKINDVRGAISNYLWGTRKSPFGMYDIDHVGFHLTTSELNELAFDIEPAICAIKRYIRDVKIVNEMLHSEKMKGYADEYQSIRRQIDELKETSNRQHNLFQENMMKEFERVKCSDEWKI